MQDFFGGARVVVGSQRDDVVCVYMYSGRKV